MDDKIRRELRDIADQHNIEIIGARQRGSRRIGAEHDDSDHDVLFLFKNPLDEYITLGDPSPSDIHAPHRGPDEMIDLHGWDVQKFGRLLEDSNPDALNYCRTHKKYLLEDDIFVPVAQHAIRNANLMALYHHYFSMAKSNYNKYIDGDAAPIDRQFRVSRAIACANYIRQADDIPPLHIDQLVTSDHVHDAVSSVLGALLDERRDGNGEASVDSRVEGIYHHEQRVEVQPNKQRTKRPDRKKINEFIKSELTNGSE